MVIVGNFVPILFMAAKNEIRLRNVDAELLAWLRQIAKQNMRPIHKQVQYLLQQVKTMVENGVEVNMASPDFLKAWNENKPQIVTGFTGNLKIPKPLKKK